MIQILRYLTPIVVPVKRKFLVSIFLLAIFSINAQNSFNSADGWGAGWGTGSSFSPSAGSSLIYTATNSSGIGDRYFRFYGNGTPCGQYGPISANQQLQTDIQYNNTTITCGNNTYAYFLDVANNTDNYVFKSASVDAARMVIFKIQGAIRTVSSVTQSPLVSNARECHATTVTATLDGTLSPGQAVYMRYTKDSYTNSTVVQLTGSGTTYSGAIPSAFNTAGANVSYYVFTSGTTTPSGADADLYTINLNNNGGPNYSYTVAAGGATTFVPDNNFEQALIALGLDCTLDDYVFTSNISDVLELDVSTKGISNLTGIEAFSSLKILYCTDNALTSLNVGMLSNLEFLDCQNNALNSLNITGLNNLTQMVCWSNNLTTLDLSTTPSLVYLDCDDNDFISLDVSQLKNLNQFYCSRNNLSSLDVRGLTNLVKYGDVPGNFECIGNPALTCILVDDVPAANTATVTIDPTNDPISPYWKKDAGATYSYCSCSAPITWNGTAWSNGTGPTSQTDAIISGAYSQSANISACSLTINTNAIVTIPSGFNVILNAPIIVTSGSFTLENNANLIQTNKNSVNSGVITVKRNSNSLFRLDYTMWSSPVSGTQTLGNFSPLTDTTRFYEYNATTDLYNAVSSGNTFSLAKGYLIRMPNEDPSNLGGASSYALGSSSLTYNGIFTGVPNNGNVSHTSLTSDKYYAVGNPYASTISANAFINGNSTDGTLYFWRKKNAGAGTAYATYNLAGSTVTAAASGNGSEVPNGTIQVGQGFIVKTGLLATTLNFNNTMRTANNANQIFKTRDIVDANRVWLNLTNTTGVFSQALVGYMTNATQGIDAGIDGKYINDSPIALTSNINNEEYTIQGRALPFDASDVVALNFKTDVTGDYTIAIDHMDGLFSGSQDIFLRDNTTGTETDLKAGAYTFTAAAGVDNARFSLKYQKTLGVSNPVFDDNSVTVYKNKGTLYVNSGAVAIANIKIFDIQGRLIAERNNVKANSASINNLKSTKQVLIVKITSQDDKVVSKKVVN